jgi:hypothetical protein
MKSIVSFQLLDNPSVIIKPDIGFIKLYFKNNILTSKNAIGLEKNLVLDSLLTGLLVNPVAIPIVATDSIIQAFGKLQGNINTLTSSIPTDISDLTDITEIIPTNTSDLVNDSGFITLGDIPAIPSDISDLTDNTGIIPTATSDLTNDSNFIVIGDVPNTIVENSDVDDTNIAIGKILQVGADGITHEYVTPLTKLTATITIAVADWGGGTTCTKAVAGLLATDTVLPIIDAANRQLIADFAIKTVTITAGNLNFTAETTPDEEITFKIDIIRGTAIGGGVVWFGGGGEVVYERKSETFYAPSYISYLGFAPDGSLETDAVWTITKRVGSADGTIVSNVQYFNKKWTERGLL